MTQDLWRSEDDTRAFAARLAASPAISDAFIELYGELGAGKTTFVRHLLRALGVQGRIKSPTYAVVEPYSLGPLPLGNIQGQPGAGPGEGPALNIWHFDFYRFNDPREWDDAGFRDLFASPGLKLAEWPGNAAGQLPTADLVIHIEVLADESRQVMLRAQSPSGWELLG